MRQDIHCLRVAGCCYQWLFFVPEFQVSVAGCRLSVLAVAQFSHCQCPVLIRMLFCIANSMSANLCCHCFIFALYGKRGQTVFAA
jgi:hypothetical protein